jgi:hypothetical protein
MMLTTKRRKKISSAAELREEEGVGQKAPGNDRNQLSRAAVWEASGAEPVEVARVAAPLSAAVHPLAPRTLGLVRAHPGALAALRSAQPRLERVLLEEPPPVHRLPVRDPQGVPPVVAQRRRPQRARPASPAGKNPRESQLPARQLAQEPGRSRRRRRRQAARRQEPGKAGPGRQQRVNPPDPEAPPSRADAAEEARRQGQGVAREDRIFLPRAQYPKRGYSRVAALFLTDPCEEYAGERRT